MDYYSTFIYYVYISGRNGSKCVKTVEEPSPEEFEYWRRFIDDFNACSLEETAYFCDYWDQIIFGVDEIKALDAI